jgi:polysaccharide export outer membrane protein
MKTRISAATRLTVSQYCVLVAALAAGASAALLAQASAPAAVQAGVAGTAPPVPAGVTPPPGYVIGPDDNLAVMFWREKELSADVVVRPDGMISLPLLNDIKAAGLTPEELRLAVVAAAGKYVEEPTATVVIKAINSRKIFITGQVSKPGTYPLGGPTTVLQFLATAGGALEYADTKKIVIVRSEDGRTVTHRFNYKEVLEGKNLKQNIELKPGDTVVVPE